MDKNSEIQHYGIPRKSGRYPWGSGENPEQRNRSFLGYVDDLKKKGVSEAAIAEGMGLTTTQLRAKKSIIKAEQRKADVAQALRLKNKGYSNVAIGERMGINESSVRALLNPAIQTRSEITDVTASMLKKSVADKGYVDVGAGVERYVGVSRTKLKTSIEMLKEEGYTIHYIPVEQLGTGKKTYIMTLASPGVSYSEVFSNKDKIKMLTAHSDDGGRSFLDTTGQPNFFRSIDSNKIQIRYAEEGGSSKDGVIELRRGVEELSLGNSKYAQVRVSVDGTHFMKGMAMYSDNLPPGVDVIYNTVKTKGTPKEDVFKKMKDDPDNPFGATVRQKEYIDKNGNKKFSALNIVNEEGDWNEWSDTISSQMLSKQSTALAKQQLGLVRDIKRDEFNEIMSLTNPVIKKKLLESFADDADSAASHLKAAALPRQKSHVILPIPSIKDDEIYAPKYRDGEKVVLIRHPHGGIFEIPELTVNNRNKEANRVMKNAADAVGINAKVAEKLSGADFDGDTVLVIPNTNKIKVKTSGALEGLKDFDPRVMYAAYEGMPTMSPRNKQMKMGDVSNLITDMTIKRANEDEIARAVRHSMVVIDAEKHNLNYRQSHIDNGIAALKKKYQGGERSGASTLISRASSEVRVGMRKERIDPETGRKIYEYTGETYTNKKGVTTLKTETSTKMHEVSDAHKLSSGTPMETIYADHANGLKSIANQARKEMVRIKPEPASPSARLTYAKEVATLNAKLNVALKNAPLERQAQLLGNAVVSAKKANNPSMEKADIKKIKGQALAEARIRTGAGKQRIVITEREWEAIQARAVSPSKLAQILNNTDLHNVKKLATPRSSTSLTDAKLARARAMLAAGNTQAEVADQLGISTSMLVGL
jgi:DNA-binding CsgD family transcriptional regulator